MADKSPRQHMQKKSDAKSIKEKRADKKAKAGNTSIETTPTKKR